MASNPPEIHGCLVVSLILTALTIVPVTASMATESESQAEPPSAAAGSSYPILPRREGLPPKVTLNIPNRQIDVNPVPEVNEELFRRAFALPGVENRPTILSVPGVRGLWLNNKISLVHPEIIRRGREFAHIHADGSLHIALPVERAREAVRAGWALPHPMSNQEGWGRSRASLYPAIDGTARFDFPDNCRRLQLTSPDGMSALRTSARSRQGYLPRLRERVPGGFQVWDGDGSQGPDWAPQFSTSEIILRRMLPWITVPPWAFVATPPVAPFRRACQGKRFLSRPPGHPTNQRASYLGRFSRNEGQPEDGRPAGAESRASFSAGPATVFPPPNELKSIQATTMNVFTWFSSASTRRRRRSGLA